MSQINVNTIALANGTEQARLVQVVNVTDSAVATGTTQMPRDNTIPQNTEGDQYMSLAITPTHASNKLLIQVVVQCTSTIVGTLQAALFKDSTAGALAATQAKSADSAAEMPLVLNHYMTTGGTSAITFKVRLGVNGSNTTTFNGAASAGYYGGVSSSSITISEIRV